MARNTDNHWHEAALMLALIRSAVRANDEQFLASPFCQHALMTYSINLETARRECKPIPKEIPDGNQ